MNVNILIRFLGAVLIASPLLLSNPAFAADGKSYPGTICQYWTASGSDGNANRSRLEVSQFGWIGNDREANKRIGVVCPLIRDSMRAGIERVMVRGWHPDCPSTSGTNCPGNSECTLRIMPMSDGFPRQEIGPHKMVRWEVGDAGGREALMFAGFVNISVPDFVDAESPGQGSTIVLFCRLAPGARINSIYVGEGT